MSLDALRTHKTRAAFFFQVNPNVNRRWWKRKERGKCDWLLRDGLGNGKTGPLGLNAWH